MSKILLTEWPERNFSYLSIILPLNFSEILNINELTAHLKADFHSVEFSDWTGIPLLTCENVALNLNRMLRVTNVLSFQIQSARKILLSGNQPLYFSSFEDVTSSNFQIIIHKGDRLLQDTILKAFINYGFLENYFFMLRQTV